MNQDEILTIEEACLILKISEKLLYQLAKEKDFPARKIGREWRFLKSELLDWFMKQSRVSPSGNDFIKEDLELIKNTVNWTDKDFQSILKEITYPSLLIWMLDDKNEKFREKIYKNLSVRAAAQTKEDVESLEKETKEINLKILADTNYQYVSSLVQRIKHSN